MLEYSPIHSDDVRDAEFSIAYLNTALTGLYEARKPFIRSSSQCIRAIYGFDRISFCIRELEQLKLELNDLILKEERNTSAKGC